MRFGEYPPTSPPHPDEWALYVAASPLDSPAHDGVNRQDPELLALKGLGFAKPLLDELARKARDNGTSIEQELLHSQTVDEVAYYGAMARFLRLPFKDRIDPGTVADSAHIDTQLHLPNQIRISHRYQAPQIAVVPEAARLAHLGAALEVLPMLARDLVITTPSAIRDAVWKTGAVRRAHETTHHLFERLPGFSARIVMTGAQGFCGGLAAATILCGLIVAPFVTLDLLHIILSITYLAALALRASAMLRQRFRPQTVPVARAPKGPLPCYTVMVALYREAAVVGQLVHSLKRLDWPASLLDIKLVCEADDAETLTALKALDLGAQFEIVEVPASDPRTKPKALSYALVSARGEFLAIYDAEDRPHPQQLREAYARFRGSAGEVACLQAPLIITNASDSWISALFSLEYSGLFRGLLPMLARMEMPLPLGGTSNHFRTGALRAVGGWDPFNVTEDADLGLRLFRQGFRAGVLNRQTLEDAPTTVSIWMGQRSRWFKGWVQTWLVLMRDPRRLMREMGWKAFWVMQLLVGGMLVSSLLHPLIIVFVAIGGYSILSPGDISLRDQILFAIDLLNILGSYCIFLGLGIGTMIRHERRMVGWRWIGVPVYWLMISFAAWRAVSELRSKPFFWNKTPHKPVPKADK